MSRANLPGSAIGVLGSGQLGRMFAIAARQMGYRVHTLSPDDDTPTGQVADLEVVAAYDDLDAVRRFARDVSVVTFEFENVPAAAASAAAEFAPVRPAGSVLHTTQHRLREKTFLQTNGFPLTSFVRVTSTAELEHAVARLGTPAVLKSADWGYDGKGQQTIRHPHEAAESWKRLGAAEAVLEAFVAFEQEVSVIVARGLSGEVRTYPVFANTHTHHILDWTLAPAELSRKIAAEADEIARHIASALELVGVLCVEFFITRDGRLLVNELAPRPHNSGHLTIDASITSQFEQQVRSVCGLPLGSTEPLRPAAMANLLGDLWQHGEPDWAAACASGEIKLHLYGKSQPRPGRKMGHLTALAQNAEEARQRVLDARRRLVSGDRPA